MNEEKSKMFSVQTEDGVVRDAQLLFVFELEENGKDYAVYTIPGPDNMENVFGGVLTKDSTGAEILQDLESEEEKEMIKSIVDGLASGEIVPTT